VSSLLGLFVSGHYTGSSDLLARNRTQDATILAVGVPALAAGLWLARRGSVRGQFLWLGSLAYMVYMWASYALTLSFNTYFLGYLALFVLSTFTLAGGVLALDADAVKRTLAGRISRPLFVGFLVFTTVGLSALWLSELIPATIEGTEPAVVEEFDGGLATYVLDLGLVVPALVVAAGWLWRDRAWGYATTGVLLVFAAVLAPTLTATLAVDATTGVSMTVPMMVLTAVPPLIGAAFAIRYLLAIDGHDVEPVPEDGPTPG
jgi:hypothetical protein